MDELEIIHKFQELDLKIDALRRKVVENENKSRRHSARRVQRYRRFQEAKARMLERNGKWYRDDAKGIFKYFKLFDDDIWLDVAEKYKEIFSFYK